MEDLVQEGNLGLIRAAEGERSLTPAEPNPTLPPQNRTLPYPHGTRTPGLIRAAEGV